MKFSLLLEKENLSTFLRRCGYAPEKQDSKTGEARFWKSITGRRYPRFHIFAQQKGDETFLRLHLDQKAPSYKGFPAHSGEYQGELVEKEAERIVSLAS